MRIGIDIDGVLNYQYEFCIHYGSKFCKEIGKYTLVNIKALDTTDMFGWSNEIAHQFWNKYRKDLACDLKAKMFASEVLELLKKEGHEIYIITARKNNDEWCPKSLANYEEHTKKWLAENNILYDKLCFNTKDKGAFCKKHNVDFMVEDDPKNLRTLINNTNVIVYDAPYNRNEEFNNLLRVYNWYDLYSKLNLLKQKEEGDYI